MTRLRPATTSGVSAPPMGMTASELAGRIDATVRGDGARRLTACAGLEEAGVGDVSFLANRRYAKMLGETQAGAVIVSAGDAQEAPPHITLLVAKDPYFAFRQAVIALHGSRPQPAAGVSPQACIDPSAAIGADCTIQPLAYIAESAVIGRRCVIYPHCYVGPHARLGDDCILYPNVTIYDHCVLGHRVTLHAGCVIGQDGFGYATHQGAHHKIPQVGNVIIEDDVEMGANCAIDRATVGSTVIGKGSKFSDLVAIGHGARIGPHNLLVAQVGIAGSTSTGQYVVMGGQVGVAGHLEIGAQAQIAAKAGVMSDLGPKESYGGIPALPLMQAKRNALAVNKLPSLQQEFRKLKKRVAELEKQLGKSDEPT